ncbi:MAG: histidine kinase [Firmicutes bacterium]|nr:histidine kinase [Bacillota bacterium]
MIEFIDRVGVPVFIQTVLESWNGVFLLIILFSLIIGRKADRETNTEIPLTNKLITFYAAIFLYNIFDIFYCLQNGSTSLWGKILNPVSNFFYFAVGAFLTLYFLQLVKKQVAEKNGLIKLQKAAFTVQLLHIPCLVLLVLTPFTKALYWFDENNYYHRGTFYWVWHCATMISFIFIAVVSIVLYKRIERFTARIISVSAIIPLIAFICSIAYRKISFNNISVSIAALLVFMLYEKYRTTIFIHNAKELENKRYDLMKAQIKPHFINNAMTAIQELCYEDPEKAAELINHFTRYLRNNIDVTNGMSLIPVEKETDAVKEYLALEYADTEKKFSFEFNLGCTNFQVPALSIETLVENAVKHGIDRYSESSRVILTTCEDNENYIVMLKDNGVGFDPNEETLGKGGIGLQNTISRLEISCGGRLDIDRRDGWTTVKIIIPKKEANK